ncbi:MAG: flagellar biosynthesis protein FlhF [Vibrionaceae bacterium]
MKIKRFFAKDMRTALAQVKETLGAEAVIMSNKKLSDGIELVAAIDVDPPQPKPSRQAPAPSIGWEDEDPLYGRDLQQDKVQLRRAKTPLAEGAPELNRRSGPARGNKFASLLDKYNEHLPENDGHDEPEADDEQYMLSTFLQRSKNEKKQARKQGRSADFLTEEGHSSRKLPSAHQVAQQEKSQRLASLYQQQKSEEQQTNTWQNSRTKPRNQNAGKEPNAGEIDGMRQEISAIRGLLEHQLAGLMWQEMERKEPLRAMLIKRLERIGFSPALVDQLASYIPENLSPREAWDELLSIISDQIITAEDNLLEEGGVIALLGPTGVGKTTTIAKLAARAAMDFGADDVALVTTDTFRIGAHEQLATYGRILSCPVKVAKNAQELADILYQFRYRRLVLLDTAGMGQRDMRLSEQLDTLIKNSGAHIRSFLVLSATSQRRVLQETIDHFCKIPLSGCILTKLDESLSLGEMISVMIEYALPIAYLTNGQRVPEDIRKASGQYLVNKASELFENDPEQKVQFWDCSLTESNSADFYD